MFLLFAWLSLKYLKLLAYSLTFNIDKKSDVKKQSCIIYICLITTMERQHLFQLLTGVCIRMWETLKVELLITQNFL
mgnify:CR=1 FL=1